MALLKDDALLASTNEFISFIIIPPIAAMPWTIVKVDITLLFPIPSPDGIHFLKIINFESITNNLMQFIIICWCIIQ